MEIFILVICVISLLVLIVSTIMSWLILSMAVNIRDDIEASHNAIIGRQDELEEKIKNRFQPPPYGQEV